MGDDDKTQSPFYLGSGDQPGNYITNAILKGDNFVAWSRSIKLDLKSRRKFGFIGGTITKPTDPAKLSDWDAVNSMVVSWLTHTIDSKVASSIPYHEEARPLWLKYMKANGPRIQQLRAAITNCKQTKGMSIDDYYNRLMDLWDDLSRLKPLHSCTCGNCSCDLAGKFACDHDEERFHQFLIGVDDDLYSALRTNLLSQKPPATLDDAYQAFIQEENSRDISREKVVL